MEDQFELQAEPILEPTPTPTPKKKRAKKEQPCKDCPDYTTPDTLAEKVRTFRAKGYNDNQIAAMLMVHSQYVKTVK